MKHLIEPLDFTTEEYEEIFRLVDDIIAKPDDYSHVCDNKLLASLFFEPSTRTRLSFETAMLRLGGQVIGFSDAGVSSSTKGETLLDTIRVIENYADICAMRHPKEGAALMASKVVKTMPIINAGDGGHFHPTQTLADLITIRHYKGSFDNLTVGLCGDLKFGRTIHSLVRALNRYENVKFIFISPEELKMPDPFKNFIDKENYEETRDLASVIDDLDVLYMSRVQKERFVSSDEYERLKDYYILNEEKLKNAKEDMIILHPLPRVNEIAPEVDKDPRAVYFEQTKFGMYGRMALIMKLLEARK
ncbi:aspartate carbamoyltransferase [Peptoniphilus harei]|uniref:aspartate carbamoyltransferase n=2 Tax=Peptoniphilus harei TaxID=54005 RepID=UPI000F71310B|nr:aspartate carbamoyltransferase [Peptoniphilus harei]MDU1642200.1 aspartate carbamoyltransferase [Peptoniphilus harei]MDU5470413.1 aspartate carbamoyltransferase [Peptoniphilus harei]MDU6098562.1 aspartate carbamoyltransferase [Peptoniphilus harei]MDU6742719.1 aspartate carbamoyltransferase [Peptoniphilus harei]QQE46153.1 aspartate carbamoyltransferase [Peptoniphilus harei]